MHSLNFSFILEDNCNLITYKFAGYQSSIPDFKHKHGELSSSPPSPHPLTPHHHHPQHDLISSSLFFSPSSSSSFLHIIQQKIIPQRTKYQPFPFPEATLHPYPHLWLNQFNWRRTKIRLNEGCLHFIPCNWTFILICHVLNWMESEVIITEYNLEPRELSYPSMWIVGS